MLWSPEKGYQGRQLLQDTAVSSKACITFHCNGFLFLWCLKMKIAKQMDSNSFWKTTQGKKYNFQEKCNRSITNQLKRKRKEKKTYYRATCHLVVGVCICLLFYFSTVKSRRLKVDICPNKLECFIH